MNETFCTYPGKRDEVIVAYLYGEMDVDERAAFDRHLVACAPCRAELADLRGVRSELARWAPPEPATHIPFNAAIPRPAAGIAKTVRSIPVWAQAMAATLILGVAAGAANLEVSYSAASGLSIRTGWRHPADLNASQPAAVASAAVQTATSAAPWSKDLAALERDLRGAIDARPAVPTPVSSTTGDEATLRRVRQMVQDSERRQESELALRMAEAVRELQAQRQADLVKIDRTLGLMQNRTGIEVMRTQRQVNTLAQQVSQRP
jgi:putative zinc finger protein